MCMAKGPQRPSKTVRPGGWSRNSYYGYDPEREADYASRPDLVAMGRAGISGAAIAQIGANWFQGMKAREEARGYQFGGFANQRDTPLRDTAGNIITPNAADAAAAAGSMPAFSTAPATAPVNPFEGLNINIPDPPPPAKAYQDRSSPSSKKQRRAKTRKSSAKGKAGLTIERINY